jgi:hypothetical protein
VDSQQQVDSCAPALQGRVHYDELLTVIRDNIEGNPNSWMVHSDEARNVFATGDTDAAVKAKKPVTNVPPEEMIQLSKK